MDLYIHTTREKLGKIFEKLGFRVYHGKEYSGAILKKKWGRFHAKFTELNNKIYCDFHFDLWIHLSFLGVDYNLRPKKFFEENIKKTLHNHKIKYVTKEVNFLSRRNRAIFLGFRL